MFVLLLFAVVFGGFAYVGEHTQFCDARHWDSRDLSVCVPQRAPAVPEPEPEPR